jgi:4-hydroxy-2-oxoheptanedioate aldolase
VSRTVGLRARLREPRPFLTLFSIIPAVEVVELAALAGFDGIILDTEHGSYGTETLATLILAARASGVEPIVRVRTNDPSLITAALDAGASGVLVPQIGSVSEASAAVRAARFAPAGTRGANPWVRAAHYGAVPDWFDTADEEIAVLLMIEGANGLGELEEILAVPDLDGIFLGPVDLSHALGVPGQVEHPAVQAAVRSAIDTARTGDIAVGLFTPAAARAGDWLDAGVALVAVGVDTAHLGQALAEVTAEIRLQSRLAM